VGRPADQPWYIHGGRQLNADPLGSGMGRVDPGSLSDEDLLAVLERIDADKYPERSELVRAEVAWRFPDYEIPTPYELKCQHLSSELDLLGYLERYLRLIIVLGTGLAGAWSIVSSCDRS